MEFTYTPIGFIIAGVLLLVFSFWLPPGERKTERMTYPDPLYGYNLIYSARVIFTGIMAIGLGVCVTLNQWFFVKISDKSIAIPLFVLGLLSLILMFLIIFSSTFNSFVWRYIPPGANAQADRRYLAISFALLAFGFLLGFVMFNWPYGIEIFGVLI